LREDAATNNPGLPCNYIAGQSFHPKTIMLKRVLSSLLLIILFASPRLFSQNINLLDSLSATIRQGAYKNIDAIVISHHGKTIYEQYFNGYTKDSLHDTRSSFKSVAGLLTGIAIDKGFIKSVQEKVYPFFPEYKHYDNPDSRKAHMTIQHLLEMKSGYNCEEWNSTNDCENKMMDSAKDWVKYSLDMPLLHEPGTVWSYMSANAMLLGGVIAHASHMPIDQFAAKYLFTPLGITRYRWTKDAVGQGTTAGSFYILPTDMLKIGELVLNKGVWKGKQIVSAQWINEATKRITQIEDFSNVQISKAKDAIPQPTWYGYTWYNEEIRTATIKHNVVFASGNGGQYMMVIKDLDLVVVFTGNSYGSARSKLPFEVLIRYVLPYLDAKK
jgi:CubicO group peptidase (beta-lactamase class C family)